MVYEWRFYFSTTYNTVIRWTHFYQNDIILNVRYLSRFFYLIQPTLDDLPGLIEPPSATDPCPGGDPPLSGESSLGAQVSGRICNFVKLFHTGWFFETSSVEQSCFNLNLKVTYCYKIVLPFPNFGKVTEMSFEITETLLYDWVFMWSFWVIEPLKTYFASTMGLNTTSGYYLVRKVSFQTLNLCCHLWVIDIFFIGRHIRSQTLTNFQIFSCIIHRYCSNHSSKEMFIN